MAMPTFTMRQLLEAGVHFGHQTRRWNPRMAPYLFGVRNGVHIIDLTQTVPLLHRALVATRDVAAAGGRILFVGTKRQAQEPVTRSAKRSGQYYVNHRWLGGMLTNWKTISHSIRRLRELEGRLAEGTPRPDQEGDPAAHPRARQARARARRHQGHGRPARPDLRDRHQQGGDRGRRGEDARHPGGRGGRQQLRARRHRLSGAGQRRRLARDQPLLRSDGRRGARRHPGRDGGLGRRHRRDRGACPRSSPRPRRARARPRRSPSAGRQWRTSARTQPAADGGDERREAAPAPTPSAEGVGVPGPDQPSRSGS